MMLETLGEAEAAKAIDQSVSNSLASGKIKSLAAGKMGMGTRRWEIWWRREFRYKSHANALLMSGRLVFSLSNFIYFYTVTY